MDFGRTLTVLLLGLLGACTSTRDAHHASTLDLLLRPGSFERHLESLKEERHELLAEIAYLDEQIALTQARLRQARSELLSAEGREGISASRRESSFQRLNQLRQRSDTLSSQVNSARDTLTDNRQPAADSYQALKQEVEQLEQDTQMLDSAVDQLLGLRGEQAVRQPYPPY